MIAEGSIILFLGFALLMAIGAPLAVALGTAVLNLGLELVRVTEAGGARQRALGRPGR